MYNCLNCKYGVDYGDSVEFIYCIKGSRKKTVKKIDVCEEYKKEKDPSAATEKVGNE